MAAHVNDYIAGERSATPAALRRRDGQGARPGAARRRRPDVVRRGQPGQPARGAVVRRPERARLGRRQHRSATSPTRSASRSPSQGLTTRAARKARRRDVVPAQAAVPGRLLPARLLREGRADCDGNGPPTRTPTSPRSPCSACRASSTNPAVDAALAKAVAWLKATQAADGSFGGGGHREPEHQQHRPGRLGARRVLRDRGRQQGGGVRPRASRSRPGRPARSRAEVGRGRLRRRGPDRRPRPTASPTRPATSGGARPRRPSRRCAGTPRRPTAPPCRSTGPKGFVKGGEPGRRSRSPVRPPASGSALSDADRRPAALDGTGSPLTVAGRPPGRRAARSRLDRHHRPGAATATVEVARQGAAQGQAAPRPSSQGDRVAVKSRASAPRRRSRCSSTASGSPRARPTARASSGQVRGRLQARHAQAQGGRPVQEPQVGTTFGWSADHAAPGLRPPRRRGPHGRGGGAGVRRGHLRAGRGGRLLGGDRRDGRGRPRLARRRRRQVCNAGGGGKTRGHAVHGRRASR